MALNLLSSTSRVETPFILATIGGYTFGLYDKETRTTIASNKLYRTVLAQYPNYMKSLQITKINGAVNTYTLTLVYAIRNGDDPNLLEKIFSSASSDRKIILSYGDLSIPNYIYKEEEGIITDIKSNLNIANSSITYTLNCTSQALTLSAGNFSFPKRVAKPSDVIKEILYDSRYGMLNIFYGMIDKDLIISKGLIAGDDKSVTIEAQKHISLFDYLNYLVNCMRNTADSTDALIKKSRYVLTVYDDMTGIFGGPYFKVSKISSNIKQTNSLDVYEIDIGYPGENMVTGFNIDDNQTYSIFYNYSNKVKQSDYVYRIDDKGNTVSLYSPTLGSSNKLLKMTESDSTWWSQVTQFPITVSLTIKGLLRPAILMTYVKLNTLFYGRKHISSGYYIITKQDDYIDESGYKTTLRLTRIQEDS